MTSIRDYTQDSTDWQSPEEALRQTNDRLLSVVNHVLDGIITIDERNTIKSFNPAAERIFGYPAGEVIGQNVKMLMTEPYRSEHDHYLAEYLRTGESKIIGIDTEVHGRRKDGSTFPVEVAVSTFRMGERRFFTGIVRDITQRRMVEQRLRAQYATTRALAECETPADALPRILEALCENLGWDWGNFWQVHQTDQRLRCSATWHKPFLDGSEFSALSRTLTPARGSDTLPGRVWASGGPAWITDPAESGLLRGPAAAMAGLRGACAFPVSSGKDVLGVIEFFSHTVREPDDDLIQMMTAIGSQVGHFLERRRGAEQLLQLADMVHYAEDAFFGKSLDGIVLNWNPAAERLFGYTAAEIVGKSIAVIYPPDRKTELHEIARRVKRGERIQHYETVRRRKDGTAITVSKSISPIKDMSGQVIGVAVSARDITEQKRLEQQVRQSQKMEAIGQLAGGVAHDFNNLLTIISGYSEMLLSSIRPNDPAKGLLKEIQKAGERAASLTRQLLAFSRKQVLELRVLDLNAVVSDTEKMLQRLIGEDVRLATVLAPALGRVKADAGQIEQVIMNLAVNARDAMPRGGKLTIETANADLDESHVKARPEIKPGRYVLLAVSDTGCGMDEATKARIFEPFFTTKAPGKGTGLGLATVYGIVKQSGGFIYVYSEPGRGTSFKVYLPSIEQPVSSGKSLHGLKPTAFGSETVLLVEDEEAVRGITQLALQMHGYNVLVANGGEEAVCLCENHQGSIHLLVTDVVMPDMGGRQVAERLSAMRPGIKVLYLSGYTDDAVVRHGVLEAETPFLQKPFTPVALAMKVREVLDQKP